MGMDMGMGITSGGKSKVNMRQGERVASLGTRENWRTETSPPISHLSSHFCFHSHLLLISLRPPSLSFIVMSWISASSSFSCSSYHALCLHTTPAINHTCHPQHEPETSDRGGVIKECWGWLGMGKSKRSEGHNQEGKKREVSNNQKSICRFSHQAAGYQGKGEEKRCKR